MILPTIQISPCKRRTFRLRGHLESRHGRIHRQCAGDFMSSDLGKSRHTVLLLLAAASLFGAAYIFVGTMLGALGMYNPVPFWDEWEYVSFYADPPAALIDQVWAQHSEHRIPLTHLISLADYKWFSGRRILLYLAIFVTQLLHALLFCIVIAKASLSVPLKAIAFAVIFGLLFSANQMENFIWAFEIQLVAVFFFASCAFLGLAKSAQLVETSEKSPSAGVIVLALFSAFAATASITNGILVWPLLLALAIWLKTPLRFVLPIAGVGAMATAIYLIGYDLAPGQTNLETAAGRMPWVLYHVIIFLGNPARLWGTTACAIVGGLGILALAALLWHALRHQPNAIVKGLTTIAFFIVGSASLVAAGRLQEGIEAATSSRYATAAFVFWAALFSAALRLEHSQTTAKPSAFGAQGLRLPIIALVTPIAILQLPAQAPAMQYFIDRARSINQGALALLVGINDKAALGALYPDPEKPLRLAKLLQERRQSIFASPRAALIGRDIRTMANNHSPKSCPGRVKTVTRLDDSAVVVEGALFWPALGDPWAGILLTDASGRVVGLADPDPPSLRIWWGALRRRHKETSWRGYATTENGLKAYAVSREAERICVLAAS
jgi:hypothetical protein